MPTVSGTTTIHFKLEAQNKEEAESFILKLHSEGVIAYCDVKYEDFITSVDTNATVTSSELISHTTGDLQS
jgi:hypothetical protein